MLSNSHFDIDYFGANKNSPAPKTLNKSIPRAPYGTDLSRSYESLEEAEVPFPSLDHDSETSKLMWSVGYSRQSRHEVVSYASALRARNPFFYMGSNRDSFLSTYNDDAVEVDQHCQPHQHDRPHSVADSLLPTPHLEYQSLSHPRDFHETTLYAAPLRTSLSSSYQSVNLIRTRSFAKCSATPLQPESLCSDLNSKLFSDQVSNCSSAARPTTPEFYLTPSLSSCSTPSSSLNSIMTDASTVDTAPTYGIVGNVMQSKEKKSKTQPKRLALGNMETRASARARNISPPIPSPKFLDPKTVAAFSYHRTSGSYVPTPSPAPTLTNEISAFDFDSDNEEGKTLHRLKTVRSAFSFQNLRKPSRIRAEAASRVPTIPTTPAVINERTSNMSMERNSKECKLPASPTLPMGVPASPPTVASVASHGTAHTSFLSTSTAQNRASSEANLSSSSMRLQKVSIRSKSSNIFSPAMSPPSPPPQTPLPPIPTAVVNRRSHTSWYSCFPRADNAAANSPIATAPKKLRNKSSNHSARLSQIRVLMRRIFQPKK